MLRAVVTKLSASNRICAQKALNIGQSESNIQSIRWKRYRRPIELGTSKSKLFRIPVHKEQPIDERKELTRLNSIYRTQIKTLYAHYREEKLRSLAASKEKPQSLQDDADFARISKINDEWNRQVGKEREARLDRERREMKEQIERNLQEHMEWEEEQKRITNELVLKEKEEAKLFIVRENFDEALEQALAEKTDFNYAIDKDGNMYEGREYIDYHK